MLTLADARRGSDSNESLLGYSVASSYSVAVNLIQTRTAEGQ